MEIYKFGSHYTTEPTSNSIIKHKSKYIWWSLSLQLYKQMNPSISTYTRTENRADLSKISIYSFMHRVQTELAQKKDNKRVAKFVTIFSGIFVKSKSNNKNKYWALVSGLYSISRAHLTLDQNILQCFDDILLSYYY